MREVLAILCLSACGGESPQEQQLSASTGTTQPTRSIGNFDVPVAEGTWWLYGRVHEVAGVEQWSVWLVTLGAKAAVEGHTAYSVVQTQVDGETDGEAPLLRATYLAFEPNRIFGAGADLRWKTYFDATSDQWPTDGGMFGALAAGSTVSAGPGAFSNAFNAGDAWGVSTPDASEFFRSGEGAIALEAKACDAIRCAHTQIGLIDFSLEGSSQPAVAIQPHPCALHPSSKQVYRCASRQSGHEDSSLLLLCAQSLPQGQVTCDNGCIVSGSADDNDSCDTTDPCANLEYALYVCGENLPGGRAGVLYSCVSQTTQMTTICPNQCNAEFWGTPDSCQ